MKYNLDVGCVSPQKWVDKVVRNFGAFLQDHADCERKASAMAMSFVAKYPDRTEIIPELIETAIEELEHFQQVYDLMTKKGIPLLHSIGEDRYMKALIKRAHSGRNERFMDRLLIASIVETRGAERFRMVAEAMTDEDLKSFTRCCGHQKPNMGIFMSRWP